MRLEELEREIVALKADLERRDLILLAFSGRLDDLEAEKDYAIHRPKIRVPKFPQCLRDIGYVPPSERNQNGSGGRRSARR